VNKNAIGEVINVGHDQPQDFLQIVKTLKNIDSSVKWAFAPFSPERKAQEPGDFYSDISKIKKICFWIPKTPLLEGLKKTWDYYKKNKPHYW
jgi:UDP-glucose 4-epimerase